MERLKILEERAAADEPPTQAAHAVAALFAEGLALRPEDIETLLQFTGQADAAEALRQLAADPDASEAAPLLALVYSPGPEAMRALEHTLAAADLTPAGAEALERAVERLVLAAPAWAQTPQGARIALAPRGEDVRAYVRRLRPAATPPATLRAPIARLVRSAPEAGLELGVLLRHSRLDWTPPRLFFLITLLERLGAGVKPAEATGGLPMPPGLPDLPDLPDMPDMPDMPGPLYGAQPAHPPGAQPQDWPGLVAWAVDFLDLAGADFDPRQALAERRQALAAQLRQAEFQERALFGGSFEVRMSQGLRMGHVHGPDVRAALERLDLACRLVLGLAGEELDGVAHRDLGAADDPEELLHLLNSPAAPD